MDANDVIRTPGDVNRSRTDDAQRKGLVTGLIIGVIGGGVIGGIVGAMLSERPSMDPRQGQVLGSPERPSDPAPGTAR